MVLWCGILAWGADRAVAVRGALVPVVLRHPQIRDALYAAVARLHGEVVVLVVEVVQAGVVPFARQAASTASTPSTPSTPSSPGQFQEPKTGFRGFRGPPGTSVRLDGCRSEFDSLRRTPRVAGGTLGVAKLTMKQERCPFGCWFALRVWHCQCHCQCHYQRHYQRHYHSRTRGRVACGQGWPANKTTAANSRRGQAAKEGCWGNGGMGAVSPCVRG